MMPAYSDDFIEVALAADHNYIVGLTVAAYSIACSCNPANCLRFHFLFNGFTEEEKADIRRLLISAKNNCEVCYYDVSDVDLSELPIYASSRMTYARLLLPKLLSDLRYVIYADVDMLWLDDLSALWELRGHVELVSCVREQSEKTKDIEESWFVSNGKEFNRDNYFCAGVSFYNLAAIRSTNVFETVFDFGRRFRGFNCADQSMMYGAIGNRVGMLPDRWQSLPRNGIKVSPGEGVVLHYAGEVPWRCTHITRMITDTQLLWFHACAIAFGESVWRSLRRFYSARRIVLSRLVFLLMFRVWPIDILSRFLLRMIGVKSFDERLPGYRLYLGRLAKRSHTESIADSSSTAI